MGMLDLDFIRNNPDKVKQTVVAKGEKVNIDAILEVDARRRGIIQALDTLRHKRNEGSQTVAQLKSAGKDTSVLVKEMSEIGREIKDKEKVLAEAEKELNSLLLWVPNIPSADVPVGHDALANELVRSWGQKPSLNFTPLPHWELGKNLGILDFESAAKIAGTNFVIFRGWGAALERALINFMLDLHTQQHHYQEIAPPYLVKRSSMQNTGQLPKLDRDMYHLKEDDVFLIPTAEVPLISSGMKSYPIATYLNISSRLLLVSDTKQVLMAKIHEGWCVSTNLIKWNY